MKAEEMALFKLLLCKFEALNSDPLDPCRKPSTGPTPLILVTVRGDEEPATW